MTIAQNIHGPIWPLGFIEVASKGTPVDIMSVVDPGSLNDPNSSNISGATREYTVRCQQLIFQGYKPDTHGMQRNTGNIYIVLRGGDRDDYGLMLKVLEPGETFYLSSAPTVRDVFGPYDIYLDADNNGDGALVTLLIF